MLYNETVIYGVGISPYSFFLLTDAKANTSHTQAASTITAGTFGGAVVATTGTDYTTSRVRNIQASTSDLTAGSSSLANGNIYLVYE